MSDSDAEVQPAPSPNEVAWGRLLTACKNENATKVIAAYHPLAEHEVNLKALDKFTIPTFLIPCAEFLGILPTSRASIKKAGLIDLIILYIESHFPIECTACAETYQTDIESEQAPSLRCLICHQGSHDCDTMKIKAATLLELQKDLPPGFTWICSACFKKNHPSSNAGRHNPPPPAPAVTAPPTKCPPPARAVTSPPAKSELQIQREEAGICPQYKQGSCPHGISGNTLYQGSKCLLYHPKRCKPFCRYGSKHRYGCSQTQCPKFHPTLCPDSVSKKECFSPSCTYPHLKGTKRKPGQGRQPRSVRDKTRNSRNTRPPANASSNTPPEPYPSSQPPPHPTYATTSPPQDLSFLVNMVQELASKMSVIERGMISSTASIPQTPAPSSFQHSWAPPNLPTPAAPQHQHIVDHPYSSQVPLSLDQSLSTNFLSSSQPPRPVNPINPQFLNSRLRQPLLY